MSRGKKPLAMQKGNLTVLQKTEKKAQEESIITGRDQLDKPPSWLVNAIAKKEFIRIVKECESIGVIGNLDINNLGGYCNAYAFYIKATKELKKENLVVEKIRKNGKVIAKNPLISVQNEYADEMRKFAALCGLTIDSRLKVATIKTTKQSQEIEGLFGDI